MTYNELYRHLIDKLDSLLEARELFSHITGYTLLQLVNLGDRPASKAQLLEASLLIARRKAGEPLQYLLGTWEFYSLPFYVGEGVLIPRGDTEALVDIGLEIIGDQKNLEVVDLCAGSGAVSIAISKTLNIPVTAVELSPQAFAYLEKNIKLNSAQVTAVKMDINQYTHDSPIDILVSNPPYIESGQLTTLQAEVRREPTMALDGGGDGLDFYKIIANRYWNKIALGGYIILEIGINQQEAVTKILLEKGFKDVKTRQDLGGIVRVVYGEK